jgi:PGF-CTERM protein
MTTETPEDVNATTETPAGEETPAGTEKNATEGDKKEDSPGFGVVLGLVGLIGVVYLVRRND